MTKWAFANAAMVLRAEEKDYQYCTELVERIERLFSRGFLTSTLSLFKSHNQQKWAIKMDHAVSQQANIIGNIIYRLLNFWRSLGEEYCQTVLVDVHRRQLVSYQKRLLLLILHIIEDQLAARHSIVRLLQTLNRASLLYTGSGAFQSISHRLLQLRAIHYPRQNPTAMDPLLSMFYKFIAGITLVTPLLSITASTTANDDTQTFQINSKHKSCPLCMELTTNPTSTSCGHVFCWNCILQWLHILNNSSCPLCRQSISPSSLILLVNY